MTDKHVALIESNTTGTGAGFTKWIRELGFNPVMISTDPDRYPFIKHQGIQSIRTNTQNSDSLVSICKGLADGDGLAGVLSSSDYYVASVAYVAEVMGLPGASYDNLSACRDKYRQRCILRGADVPVPDFYAISNEEELFHVLREISPPFIMKPSMGSGSVGVRLNTNVYQVLDHFLALNANNKNERGQVQSDQCVLVERYIPGDEYSVEIFSGKVVGITKKYLSEPPAFTEIGHDYPAVLDPSVAAKLEDTALKAVKALKLEWGAVHAEIKYSDGNCWVIEINGRLAGGNIPNLIKLSQGIDLILQSTRLACGFDADLEKKLDKEASIRFLIPGSSGVLKGIKGVNAAKRIPGIVEVQVYKKRGELISLNGDFRDRIGHVISLSEKDNSSSVISEQAREIISFDIRHEEA